ncbi:hypothetical protein [Gloeomargarita sp.]
MVLSVGDVGSARVGAGAVQRSGDGGSGGGGNAARIPPRQVKGIQLL